jgi:hypothetical protein
MFSRAWRLLAPPALPDEEQRRSAALLNPLTLFVGLFGFFGALIAFSLGHAEAALAVGGIVCGSSGSFILLRRRHPDAASHLLFSTTFGGFVFLIYNSDGIHDIAILALPVLVLISGLLLNRRAFIAFVSLTAISLLVAAVGERLGLIVNRLSQFTSSADVVYLLILLTATVAVSSRLSRNILRNYEKVRSAKTALHEANSELQRVNDRLNQEIAEREKLALDLKRTSSEVKALEGMLPICASCKSIRDDRGYWHQVEVYIRNHTEVDFSHGICPDCIKALYPELPADGNGRSE